MARITLTDLKQFPDMSKPFRVQSEDNYELIPGRYRRAEFWKRTDANSRDITCSLCYRLCTIKAGEAGWCKYRVNEQGKMELPYYGDLGRCARGRLGYSLGGMYCYHTGANALVVGGTHCTSSCTFCTSANIVHHPDKLGWLPRAELGGERPTSGRWPGNDRGWFYAKGALHPLTVLEMAEICRATHIIFGDNEPTLSWEFTYDTARLAKATGLTVIVFTNGFTNVKAIENLAPYVDAIDLGIKGSLSEPFYAKWMRSPGATEAVKQSILAWKRAGVFMVVSNLLGTPTMQTDDEFLEASTALYDFILDNLGEHALFMQGSMHYPTDHPLRKHALLPSLNTGEHLENYGERSERALELALSAGLVYAFYPDADFYCHACDALLLRHHGEKCDKEPCDEFRYYCTCWPKHEQHVTPDGKHCGNCGARVPIEMLSPAALQQAYADAEELAALGERQFEQ